MRKVMGLLLVCLFVFTAAYAEDTDLLTMNLRAAPDGLSAARPADRTGFCELGLYPDTTSGNYFFSWEIGDAIAIYVDPAINQTHGNVGGEVVCTPPYYPFQVEGVGVYLYAYDDVTENQVGYTACIRVAVLCPKNAGQAYGARGDECSGPGDMYDVVHEELYCHTVTYDDWNAGLIWAYIPFPAGICMDRPFFVSTRLVSWDGTPGYAPGFLASKFGHTSYTCKNWGRFVGLTTELCWWDIQTSYTTPWGPPWLWAYGTAGVETCTPAVCNPCPGVFPGDDASDPFIVYQANWTKDIDLGLYCSDYDQIAELGPAYSNTAAGSDVVLKLEYPPEMTIYCFSIKIEPLCSDRFFRIRSWMADSYGPFYAGNPTFPGIGQAQYYNFTNNPIPLTDTTQIDPLGCYEWGPDVVYLYIDARNAANCVCPIRVTYTGDAPLPVLLNSFTAVAGDGRINLTWVTRSESDVASYEIVRDGAAIARVNGLGNSPTGHTYTFVDNAVENGRTYSYSLTSYDVNGNAISHNLTASATPNVGLGMVEDYALSQNYPNPFNPSTSILYSVKEAGLVTLKVYTIDGREVTTLVNETKNAGIYNVAFDGSNLASGVYLYTMKVNGFEATHKMVLMK